ncbi:hypothetical protein GH741_17785 [Aquibacillus halophilus]|uniref:Uncharacterized protein n=1 Tax=Aquibacillus halophilus TaxID=930132 RepID=A0A6A8DL72_9BACI|nr:hypothetical protein [Aquibacillus halophilus]MRH44499.1 hypothetical protein [Aquibacillus halophilus]
MTEHKNDINFQANYDFSQLKSLIEELNRKSDGIVININIENADINLSDLKDIPVTFNFEKVDIKENSGSVNFGNNLTSKSDSEKKDKIKQSDPKQSKISDIQVKLNNKIVDYSFLRK